MSTKQATATNATGPLPTTAAATAAVASGKAAVLAADSAPKTETVIKSAAIAPTKTEPSAAAVTPVAAPKITPASPPPTTSAPVAPLTAHETLRALLLWRAPATSGATLGSLLAFCTVAHTHGHTAHRLTASILLALLALTSIYAGCLTLIQTMNGSGGRTVATATAPASSADAADQSKNKDKQHPTREFADRILAPLSGYTDDQMLRAARQTVAVVKSIAEPTVNAFLAIQPSHTAVLAAGLLVVWLVAALLEFFPMLAFFAVIAFTAPIVTEKKGDVIMAAVRDTQKLAMDKASELLKLATAKYTEFREKKQQKAA